MVGTILNPAINPTEDAHKLAAMTERMHKGDYQALKHGLAAPFVPTYEGGECEQLEPSLGGGTDQSCFSIYRCTPGDEGLLEFESLA
jgi:hypothetical protein